METVKRFLGILSEPEEASARAPRQVNLAELAGGARVLQLYGDLENRMNESRVGREDYCRAVCRFVQEAMAALLSGAEPLPPKPPDTRPEWAKAQPPASSPDFLKWKLLTMGRLTIEDIEEIVQAGGRSRHFEMMLTSGHPKEWLLREIADEKAHREAKEAAIKARWPNR